MPEDSQDEFVGKIRSADQVARRCVVLHAVLAAGQDLPRDQIVTWLRREGLWDVVSPKESAFLLSDSPTQQQRVNATWRAEALFRLDFGVAQSTAALRPVAYPAFVAAVVRAGPALHFISTASQQF